ncbi:MAG: SUMF1/EgtB/PvdO family nonheme iron enzyme [Ardenticatenia bacterium]|nr:SUMF1/EgtB/PvdO family nonheme iron enzyme [Ardenticatenia bacterium]
MPSAPGPLNSVWLEGLRWSLVERSRDPAADLRVRIAAGLVLGELGDPRLKRRKGAHGDCLVPPLVRIPAGAHRLGDDRFGAGRDVQLTAFAIGALEVSNAEWACFLAGGGYEDLRWWDTPAARDWQQGLTTADDTAAQARTATARFRGEPGRAGPPVQ